MNNFDRMIQMANEVFATKSDPDQLDVDEHVIAHLKEIHPATLSEMADDNGPAIWILLIPTTRVLMDRFIAKDITEQQLADLTPVHSSYDAIYLCSAMVLEEYRHKGLAKKMTLEAVDKIRADHPIETLFVWPFTEEGNGLADSISKSAGLPLIKRQGH